MSSILKIKITLAVVAAFLSAVAIAAVAAGATSASAAPGASQLRSAGTVGYAPMSLFRC